MWPLFAFLVVLGGVRTKSEGARDSLVEEKLQAFPKVR